MANAYKIGTSTSEIDLAVDITTIGLAASRASILDLASPNPGVPVAHSVDATGDISNQSIGTSATIKGKRLTVFTQVDLTGSDAGERANEAAAIRGSYTLSGGDAGTQTLNNPAISYHDPSVSIVFVVDMQ